MYPTLTVLFKVSDQINRAVFICVVTFKPLLFNEAMFELMHHLFK